MSLPELRFVLHWILHGTVPADGSQHVAAIRQELDKKNAGKRESSASGRLFGALGKEGLWLSLRMWLLIYT